MLESLRLFYRKTVRRQRKGFLGRRGDRVRFFTHDHRFSAEVGERRVKHASYEDWRLLQLLKGQPDWFARNWELTRAKQERQWAFGGVREGTRLLEVGFRDGFNLRHLLDRGVRVEGLEVNPDSVAHARSLGCHAEEGDIQRGTAWPDASFDVVSACDVIEHCFDPEAALREIHRLLVPGGTAVIEIPFEAGFDENLAHGHSCIFPSARDAERAFEAAGFRVVDRDLSEPTRNLFRLEKTGGARVAGASETS